MSSVDVISCNCNLSHNGPLTAPLSDYSTYDITIDTKREINCFAKHSLQHSVPLCKPRNDSEQREEQTLPGIG